jgi:hypothetical protein
VTRLTKAQKALAKASALAEYITAVKAVFNASGNDYAAINYWRRIRKDSRQKFESFGGHSDELAAALAVMGITYNGLVF